jgi:uncharacterized NAD(P)/FAD-binding protein YdhS
MGLSEVAIVGGGCSGLLTAVQLVRHGFTGRITIIEPHEILGRGLAYSTTLDDHLLNVPAGKMSGLPDHPDDFLEWLRARSWPDAAPGAFAPRRLYGEYLGGLLTRFALDAAVRHVRAEVEALEAGGAGVRLRLNDGNIIEANAVVLALGNPASGPALHLPPTGMEDRWHASPWIGDSLRVRKPGERILLLGTGLTAVDTVLALQLDAGAPHTFLLSRRANLPQVHRPGAAPASLPPIESRRLNGVMRELRAHIADARDRDQCWRTVIDALRPVSNALWSELPLKDRERFLRHLRTYWETHRHRMAPAVREKIDRYRAEGRLEVLAGRLRGTALRDDKIETRIALRGGGERQLEVDRIINCTGIQENYRDHPRDFIASLVRDGLASPNDLGIGFRTDGDGALIGADGRVSPVLFTLGPPRRGELFETTALPEIRTQAAELGQRLAAR